MEKSLTVLYTYALRGQLALLPRLHTFLRRLRAEHAVGGQALLLDLGESCAPDMFPCSLTGGRSTLIALDAMGYQAAHVQNWLSEADRQRLVASHVAMYLIDDGHSHILDDVLLSSKPASQTAAKLVIVLEPDRVTALEEDVLRLAAVERGQVGMARLERHDGDWRLAAAQTFAIPELPPDPTISGTVDFILSEARYLQRKGGKDGG